MIFTWSGSFEYNLDKPAGMKQKLTDVEKLKKLGWEAPTSLEGGVKETIEFYKKELKYLLQFLNLYLFFY